MIVEVERLYLLSCVVDGVTNPIQREIFWRDKSTGEQLSFNQMINRTPEAVAGQIKKHDWDWHTLTRLGQCE